jgi:hypothetical protein
MVFRDMKGRWRKYQPPKLERHEPINTGITSLANELLLQIFAKVTTCDLLNLRLTTKLLTPVCTTLLSQRISRIYLDPSAHSLRNIINVCEHAVFSEKIEELVLLGQVDWLAIEQAWPEYRIRSESLWSGNSDTGWHKAFRPWPLFHPTVECQAKSRRSRADRPSNRWHFMETYKPLLEAIGKLPRLRSVRFERGYKGSGWNYWPQNKEALSRTTWDGAAMARTQSNNDHSNTAAEPAAAADVDVLFGMLMSGAANISTLSITTELPFVGTYVDYLHHEKHFCRSLETPSGIESLARLTSLELSFDQGWTAYTKWHHFCHALISRTMQLEHLRLVYKHNTYIQKARDEWSARHVLSVAADGKGLRQIPKLRSLAIVAPVENEAMQTPSRPLCHVIDISAFVDLHADSLERVDFKNIIFVDFQEPNLISTTLKRSATALRGCKKLEQTAWTINRFGHDARCKRQDASTFQDCTKHMCGINSQTFWTIRQRSDAADIEEFADEFSAELVDGRFWDVGNAIQRSRACHS